jgi:hypothetical protein
MEEYGDLDETGVFIIKRGTLQTYPDNCNRCILFTDKVAIILRILIN